MQCLQRVLCFYMLSSTTITLLFIYIIPHIIHLWPLHSPLLLYTTGWNSFQRSFFFHNKWVFTIIVYEGLSTSQDPAINSETTKPQILITFSKKILFWCVESDLEHKSKIFPIYFIGLQFVTCFCAKKHLNQIKIDNKI